MLFSLIKSNSIDMPSNSCEYKSNTLMNEKYEYYFEGYLNRLAKTNINEEVA